MSENTGATVIATLLTRVPLLTLRHAVKPFGAYPEVPAQPGVLLLNDIGALRAVRIVDHALDKASGRTA